MWLFENLAQPFTQFIPVPSPWERGWGEAEWLEGKAPKKIIFVMNKMINVVI
jgi:hypothetical protein